MTRPRRILWLAVFVAAPLLLAPRAAAQTYVTPTVKLTPPGQLIVVNNSLGASIEPHIGGDFVCYTEVQSTTSQSVRHQNIATQRDNVVPVALDGSQDFLCDVRETTIVFTRVGSQASILTFDTSSTTLTEIDPTHSSQKFGVQIGDQTVV